MERGYPQIKFKLFSFFYVIHDMKKCLIMGYGWLGRPLAEALQRQNLQITATTTNHHKFIEMRKVGVHPQKLNSKEGVLSWDTPPTEHYDSLIVTFPPFEGVQQSMRSLIGLLSFDQLIFTSSTGVYKESNEFLTEQSPIDPQHTVAMMEEVIKDIAPEKQVILRLAGHIGPKRHPLRYFLSKQKVIENGNSPVNLVHQGDIISAILACIKGQVHQKTYNVCFPEHPTKEAYYGKLAKDLAGADLEFTSGKIGKKIDGSKITQELTFVYAESIQNISPLDLKKDNI